MNNTIRIENCDDEASEFFAPEFCEDVQSMAATLCLDENLQLYN